MSNALKKADEEKALATAEAYGADAFDEEYGIEDIKLPFLAVIQSNSPQLKKQEAKYIPGSEMGAIFNNVTDELFDGETGIEVIPAHRWKGAIEWTPKSSGGGFVAAHDHDDWLVLREECTLVEDEEGKKKLVLPNGNELVETHTWYFNRVIDGAAYEPVIISMKSTQLSVSRTLFTKLTKRKAARADGGLFTLPFQSAVVHLRVVYDNHPKGAYYSWKVGDCRTLDPTNPTEKALYDATREFADQIKSGEKKADYTADPATAKPGEETEDF